MSDNQKETKTEGPAKTEGQLQREWEYKNICYDTFLESRRDYSVTLEKSRDLLDRTILILSSLVLAVAIYLKVINYGEIHLLGIAAGLSINSIIWTCLSFHLSEAAFRLFIEKVDAVYDGKHNNIFPSADRSVIVLENKIKRLSHGIRSANIGSLISMIVALVFLFAGV